MRIHRALSLGVVCLALAACGPDGAEPAPVGTSVPPSAAEGSPTTTCVPAVPPVPAAPPSTPSGPPTTTAPVDPPPGAIPEGMSAADAAAAAKASAERAAELAAETQQLADETMDIYRRKAAEEAARQNGETPPC